MRSSASEVGSDSGQLRPAAHAVIASGPSMADTGTDSIRGSKDDHDTQPLIEKPEPKPESEESRNARIIMGVGYMLSMGVCGVVLVAIGSTLDDLAGKCGYVSTEVGTVFIARGVGAVGGAISSATLYKWLQGNHVMGVSLGIITILICALPFNTSYLGLHLYFFALGLGTGETPCGICAPEARERLPENISAAPCPAHVPVLNPLACLLALVCSLSADALAFDATEWQRSPAFS